MDKARFKGLRRFDCRIAGGLNGRIAGIDEAGRGPLAGPVVAAAVMFDLSLCFLGLDDSKRVSPAVRETLFWEICRRSRVGIGIADEREIDQLNILQASRLAMKRAVLALNVTPELLLIDGPIRLDLPLNQRGIIQGDAKSAHIAAASIVAKVYRDKWMCRLNELYPQYEFDRHKGYPTPDHLAVLKRVGPCEVHRRSFSPVYQLESEAVL